MGNSKKGSQFERDFCKKLSNWYTKGERSDVFWRTANSGGMATARAKTGGGAFGQHGDIQAVDPIGQPLLDTITWELKRGYPACSVQRILEKNSEKRALLEDFFLQAKMQASSASTPYWALVTKRDRRDPLIWIPKNLFVVMYVMKERPDEYIKLTTKFNIVFGFKLQYFFDITNPDLFREGKA